MTTDLEIDPERPVSPRTASSADADGAGAAPPAPPASARSWRARYRRRLTISDFAIITLVVYGTQVAWFGLTNQDLSSRTEFLGGVPYWLFSAGLTIAWLWVLALVDSRSDRIMGAGVTEYSRIVDASVRLFGVIAIGAFLLRVDVARGYLLISLPVGVGLLLLSRWLWRQWLIRKRRTGEYAARVLLVGSEESVAQIASELRRHPSAGYAVVGACVPHGRVADTIPGSTVPVMGNVDHITDALTLTGADTVAITSTDDLPPYKVKQISWSLEAGRQHLVLAPSIIDIAGPRIHIRPVAGLPLIHVETPRFSGGQRFVKRAVDLVLCSVGVALISPVLLILALMVKTSSPGPVFFRQKRIGLHGREFTMLKFRSMVTNAEDLLPSLLDEQSDLGNEVLFKMEHDPRVTRTGRWMRRFSLDELPQLFNVIGGSMSLVGPRPPLPREVEQYTTHVHRRFLVKPGITGLWQVSGRSTLSWAETVRLDLSYVENWTLVGDIVILFRTLKAVLAPGGTAH